MSGSLHWRGAEVHRKYLRAAVGALNEVAGDAVKTAKDTHRNLPDAPVTQEGIKGWKNISVNAEGSIQVLEPARDGALFVLWGSRGVVYMRRLEFEHGGALRHAASLEYPKLKGKILERSHGV